MDLVPSDDLTCDRALAARAAVGDPEAVEAFERRFRPELRHVASRLGVHDEPDELVHVVLTRMLVGTAERPAKIASYRGEGSLRSWVRAVSTRFVIDHLRGVRARAPVGPLAEAGIAHSARIEGDVEARRFAELVRTSTEAAFAELTPRQRNLLRHAAFHRLGIDELAIIYRVHRTTTARWLQRTREALHTAIATKIAAATRMPADEAKSLLRNVAPDADLSLRSVLSTAFEPDDAE
jgi:RNA polymerase sigma-70 factor (ECF subfamily)